MNAKPVVGNKSKAWNSLETALRLLDLFVIRMDFV